MSPTLFSSKNSDWCTPQNLFDALDDEFDFELDAAATARSAKCARFFTPEDDGLSQSWATAGGAVWCNPPYGRGLVDWVRKAYEEHERLGVVVVLLIPARTDTAYFQDYILYGKAAEIRFLRGRLKFTDEDGTPAQAAAPFPSAIIVYR